MKLRTASLSLLVSCLILAAIPASAQIECSIGGGLYFNGPVNGQVAQLPINGGGSVIDGLCKRQWDQPCIFGVVRRTLRAVTPSPVSDRLLIDRKRTPAERASLAAAES